MSAEAAARPRLAGVPSHFQDEDDGAVRILLESKFAFDVLDPQSDFSPYRLLILPDVIRVGPELKSKIEAYVAGGGRVLMTGRSGLDEAAGGFVFDIGAEWLGASPLTGGGDYLLPVPELRASFVDDPLYIYDPAQQIRATTGRSLGDIYDPYFDRAPNHFSGHINTPNKPDPSGRHVGVEKGGFVYLAHPLFGTYKRIGAVAVLEIAERAIAHALGRPRMIETSLPRAGRATLRRQDAEKRDVLHLLHATPALRGAIGPNNIQPIQDLVTLKDLSVSIEAVDPVVAVRLVPEADSLSFDQNHGRVSFVVPSVTGHQMVEIAY